MKKALKWIGIALGGLVLLLAVVLIGLVIYGEIRFKPTHADRPLYQIAADTSPQAMERGKYLMENLTSCTEGCHSEYGDQLLAGGSQELKQGPMAVVFSVPNITQDMETGIGGWSDAKIARAIREGVDKDGVELVVMPSHTYHVMSDTDMAALLGYLRSVAPVKNEVPPFYANAMAKTMNALGAFGPRSLGEPITAPQTTPQIGTVEYGGYLVSLADCRGCHQQNLAGGPIPFAEPGTAIPKNLTPAGEAANWSTAEFIAAVRNGTRPNGGQLTDRMPRYEMTDEDLASIHLYLQSLPPLETGK